MSRKITITDGAAVLARFAETSEGWIDLEMEDEEPYDTDILLDEIEAILT